MQSVTPQVSHAIESVIKRDRLVVIAGVLAVVAIAWAYLVFLAQDSDGMGASIAMAQLKTWSAADFCMMFIMWAVMMTGMMVPSAAPMILIFATVNRRRQEQDRPYVSTAIFLSGYLLVWFGFAAIATLGNWALHVNDLLDKMMGGSTSDYLGGGLLVVAGAFQWSRLKYACLTQCRSPLSFLMTDWREGAGGALRMGVTHGIYCVGCCWVLMLLLFVLGIMNLLWIAALAGFVLLEKIVPRGDRMSKGTGLLLILWGGLMISGVIT